VILRKKKYKSGGRVLQPRWIEKESADGGAHRCGALDGDEAERSGVGWGGEMANSFSQLERRGDKTGLNGHTRPALGQQRGRELAGSHAAVAHARRQRLGGRWAVRCWTLTSGPSAILNFQWFSITQTLKFQTVTFLMLKIHQNLHRDSLKYKEQLSLLSQLRISPKFKVINSRTNSKLNLPWIFKGPKPFWKNLINSLKFHVYWIYLNIIFYWLTCIQILEVSLQVVKMT
jgi:hypothetical protein